MAPTRCGLNRRAALGIIGGAIVGGTAFALGGCDGGAPAARGQGDVTRYQYGPDPSQFAEISLPTEAAPAPIGLVPLGVPSICVHGTADALVPIEQSQRFVAAALRAGDKSELQTFGGDHFQPITVGTTAWDLCIRGLHALTGA